MNLYKKVSRSIESYDAWVRREGLKSIDPHDIWSSRYGIISKKIFYKFPVFGSFTAAPLFGLQFIPGLQRHFFKPSLAPISLAHMGSKLLFEKKGKLNPGSKLEINRLLDLLSTLKDSQILGLGWGMPFDWQTNDGFVPAYSACITQTPYILDFLLQLEKSNLDKNINPWIQDICWWAAHGVYERSRPDELAAGYSTRDRRIIVNANAYRAYILSTGSSRFGEPYTTKYLKTIRYVLGRQRPDGSWLYGESEKDSFIDHYHTAFILKNLLKCRFIHPVDGLDKAIELGKKYYLAKLFYKNGLPKPFSKAHRFQIHVYDSYDFAECIGLLSETGWNHSRLEKVINQGIDMFQTQSGWYRYRIFKIPGLQTRPYMRYANSAFALNLQKYLYYSNIGPAQNQTSPSKLERHHLS